MFLLDITAKQLDLGSPSEVYMYRLDQILLPSGVLIVVSSIKFLIHSSLT